MSNGVYHCEFASGHRATLTLSRTAIQIDWTPDVPRLKGSAGQSFINSYRIWRNECIEDFSRRTGITVAVVDL